MVLRLHQRNIGYMADGSAMCKQTMSTWDVQGCSGTGTALGR